MKCLVTGGTGFIGRHLVHHLSACGCAVKCLVNKVGAPPDLPGKAVQLLHGDICDAACINSAVQDVEYVFHLAAKTYCHPGELMRVNVIGTENLLRACLDSGHSLKKIIHVSSVSAVGPRPSAVKLTELSACRPFDNYGYSKLKGEEIVESYKKRLPIIIVRPSAVYGPGSRNPYFPLKYLKMIKKGYFILHGFKRGLFSHIYVKDVIEGLLAAALSNKSDCERYFLTSGNPVSHEDVCASIAAILKKKPVRIVVPAVAYNLKAFFKSVIPAIVPGYERLPIRRSFHQLPQYWIFDSSKSESELGFKTKTLLEEGLAKTIEWHNLTGVM